MSFLFMLKITLITRFRSEKEITPEQIIRDSEGILTMWDYLDIFQPVSPDVSAALLGPVLCLHLIFGQQERAEQKKKKLYRILNRLQSLVLS